MPPDEKIPIVIYYYVATTLRKIVNSSTLNRAWT